MFVGLSTEISDLRSETDDLTFSMYRLIVDRVPFFS